MPFVSLVCVNMDRFIIRTIKTDQNIVGLFESLETIFYLYCQRTHRDRDHNHCLLFIIKHYVHCSFMCLLINGSTNQLRIFYFPLFYYEILEIFSTSFKCSTAANAPNDRFNRLNATFILFIATISHSDPLNESNHNYKFLFNSFGLHRNSFYCMCEF